MPSRLLLLPLLAVLTLLLPGCDNPACIYGPGNCQGGGSGGGPGADGGLGSLPAGAPEVGSWLATPQPVIEALLPDPNLLIHQRSPMIVRFSESVDRESLTDAFELLDGLFGVPLPLVQPPPVVGDGRHAVIQPLAPLTAGRFYVLRLREDHAISDLTGQPLDELPGTIGEWSVELAPAPEPRVLATWPETGGPGGGDLSELMVVFDRPMDPASFEEGSFKVTVGGLDPAFYRTPTPVTVGGAVPLPLTQVWTWRNTDSAGRRVSYGGATQVRLVMSPNGFPLRDEDGGILPNEVLEFSTPPLAAPTVVRKPFAPTDAIGNPDLEGAAPLVEAELSEPAQEGDLFEVHVFGDGASSGEPIVLRRSVVLAAGVQLAHAFPTDLGLTDPVTGLRLADGDLRITATHRRAAAFTQVRLLDGDESSATLEPLLLDTVPPTFVGFGSDGGSATEFVSDQRDLTLVGRASEPLGSVRVLVSNGDRNFVGDERPPVVTAGDAGLFVARPAPVGVVDPAAAPLTFTAELFDRALNPAEGPPVTGTFLQRGVAAAGAALPGPGTLTVDVVDARTLAPLPGALVMVHRDSGGITDVGTDVTDAAGRATPPAPASGLTLVTVDLAGYDLFTFHGAPRASLQVPLEPVGSSLATSAGDVVGVLPTANLAPFDVLAADGRRPEDTPRTVGTEATQLDPEAGVSRNAFGPYSLEARRLGAQHAFAVNLSLDELMWAGPTFLFGHGLRTPAPGLPPAGLGNEIELVVPELLLAGDPEGYPLDTGLVPLGFGPPPGAGNIVGTPEVWLEAISPGSQDPWIAGVGNAWSDDMVAWRVKAAYPGVYDFFQDDAQDALGTLVERGTVEPDLYLATQMVDDLGNVLTSRPRLSTDPVALVPPPPPSVLSPAPGSTGVGVSFNLVVSDGVPDLPGVGTLFGGELQESGGRRWHLFREDPGGTGGVTLHVPNIGALGGSPLSGVLSARGRVWGWTGFDTGSFLWGELRLRPEALGRSGEITFDTNP